jgi:hypothetical protein
MDDLLRVNGSGPALREHIDPVTLNFARRLIALALFAPFV